MFVGAEGSQISEIVGEGELTKNIQYKHDNQLENHAAYEHLMKKFNLK